jgi:hypothetical protein
MSADQSVFRPLETPIYSCFSTNFLNPRDMQKTQIDHAFFAIAGSEIAAYLRSTTTRRKHVIQ